ncbi:peptide-methionine (S)-S-oxide reductase MsrA [Trueperella bialowiezensis]|uniref:Peptide methionine sulfoxide reductase MsrA n=1 Tax=Trueperella bialowiezensis TaxID=312285 RepID=A0A3S4Z4V8_9ACTO|nr:peptide-methionine (S)-S-oxide reductase MsrA [Trueperella bialowiezensis]VEI12996.1 Peptide methionine sulfoxide reductase MsrA [Trueperella bialowiezensis]
MTTHAGGLPGRSTPVLVNPHAHLALGTDMLAPAGPGEEEIFLAAGCYWGVEEIMWALPGVVTTSVGFMGGATPNPTYFEVTTGLTGHTETVRVVYRAGGNTLAHILKTFWECHDPTTLNRQGNDVGPQYRSAIFPTTPGQADLALSSREAYQAVLTEAGLGEIVTEIVDAADTTGYFPAEVEHQQYLIKVPNGYRCHARSGLACPMPGAGLTAG